MASGTIECPLNKGQKLKNEKSRRQCEALMLQSAMWSVSILSQGFLLSLLVLFQFFHPGGQKIIPVSWQPGETDSRRWAHCKLQFCKLQFHDGFCWWYIYSHYSCHGITPIYNWVTTLLQLWELFPGLGDDPGAMPSVFCAAPAGPVQWPRSKCSGAFRMAGFPNGWGLSRKYPRYLFHDVFYGVEWYRTYRMGKPL